MTLRKARPSASQVEVHREDDARRAVHAPEQRADAFLARIVKSPCRTG
jgi:hypothetical protein